VSQRQQTGAGLGLRQALQRVALAPHAVQAQVGGDVEAALAHVEVQRGLVPVQHREVELLAPGRLAQLGVRRSKVRRSCQANTANPSQPYVLMFHLDFEHEI